jgi:hypothetical protein
VTSFSDDYVTEATACPSETATSGRTYVSRTTLFCTRYGRDVPVVAFRAVVANPLTSEGDFAAILEDQWALAAVIESKP